MCGKRLGYYKKNKGLEQTTNISTIYSRDKRVLKGTIISPIISPSSSYSFHIPSRLLFITNIFGSLIFPFIDSAFFNLKPFPPFPLFTGSSLLHFLNHIAICFISSSVFLFPFSIFILSIYDNNQGLNFC